jgi:hypothetical protein
VTDRRRRQPNPERIVDGRQRIDRRVPFSTLRYRCLQGTGIRDGGGPGVLSPPIRFLEGRRGVSAVGRISRRWDGSLGGGTGLSTVGWVSRRWDGSLDGRPWGALRGRGRHSSYPTSPTTPGLWGNFVGRSFRPTTSMSPPGFRPVSGVHR